MKVFGWIVMTKCFAERLLQLGICSESNAWRRIGTERLQQRSIAKALARLFVFVIHRTTLGSRLVEMKVRTSNSLLWRLE